jgi:hypothetical protein
VVDLSVVPDLRGWLEEKLGPLAWCDIEGAEPGGPALAAAAADPAVVAPEPRPRPVAPPSSASSGPVASSATPPATPPAAPRIGCPLDALHPLRPGAGADCLFEDPEDGDGDFFVLPDCGLVVFEMVA